MPDLTRDEQFETADRFRPALVRIARRHTACQEDAEDAVGTAFLRFIEQEPDVLDRLRTEPQVRKWFKTTVVRLCVDVYRRAPSPRLLARLFASALDVDADIAEGVCSRAEAVWLARAVERLPKRQRLVAEVFMEGGGIPDVQARCGVSYDAAEHMVRETRARLRLTLLAARAAAALAFARGLRIRRSASAAVMGAPVALILSLTVVATLPRGTTYANDRNGRVPGPSLTPTEWRASTAHETENTPLVREARIRTTTLSPSVPPTAALPVVPTPSITKPPPPRPSDEQRDENVVISMLSCVEHLRLPPERVGC